MRQLFFILFFVVALIEGTGSDVRAGMIEDFESSFSLPGAYGEIPAYWTAGGSKSMIFSSTRDAFEEEQALQVKGTYNDEYTYIQKAYIVAPGTTFTINLRLKVDVNPESQPAEFVLGINEGETEWSITENFNSSTDYELVTGQYTSETGNFRLILKFGAGDGETPTSFFVDAISSPSDVTPAVEGRASYDDTENTFYHPRESSEVGCFLTTTFK